MMKQQQRRNKLVHRHEFSPDFEIDGIRINLHFVKLVHQKYAIKVFEKIQNTNLLAEALILKYLTSL